MEVDENMKITLYTYNKLLLIIIKYQYITKDYNLIIPQNKKLM